MVERAKDVLEKTSLIQEKKLLDRFFYYLAKDPDMIVYGYEDTKKALEMGAVDVLLISEDFDKEKLKELVNIAEQMGTRVEIISKKTPEGEQFANFKVGGILRYKIYES